MKKRFVGVAVAAIACASATFSPAQAGQTPRTTGADSPPQARGTHRVTFLDGRPTYTGPGSDNTTIARLLQQAPEASIEDVWREAVNASLRQLGAPASRFPQQRSHDGQASPHDQESLLPGQDWDRDGDNDILSILQSDNGTTYAALDGRTGQERWHWHTPSTRSFGVPALVGNGEPGVLVVAYGGVSAVAGSTVTARVIALRYDGLVLWEALYRGQFAYVPTAGWVARDVPRVSGVGQLTPSSASDVVIGRESGLGLRGERGRVAVEVIDGADGAPVWGLEGIRSADAPHPVPTVDVTGDGLDDVVQISEGTVTYLRGHDGNPVWRADGLRVDWRPPVPVGDLTGDGRADLAVGGDPWAAVPAVQLLDGGTGGRLTEVPGRMPTAAGDVDGDGRGDVNVVEVTHGDGAVSIAYRAFSAEGHRLRATAYALPADADTKVYAAFGPTGDVDADGVQDVAHSLVAFDDNGDVRQAEEGVVSGANGLRRWSGDPGRPAEGSLDGDGADVLVTRGDTIHAIDGKSGRELWAKRLPTARPAWAYPTGDVDADGRVDVVAEVLQSGTDDFSLNARPWVLSGADGRVLWGRGVKVING